MDVSKIGFNISLHGLRGLAAFLIFIMHSTNGYINHICPQCKSNILENFSNFGTFSVSIFFFLSGFVIFVSAMKSDTKKFAMHRFWRIYPVYLFFTVIFFIANSFLNIREYSQGFLYFIENLFFIQIFLNSPTLTPNAWSIFFEVWYYVITYLLVYSIYKGKNLFTLIIGVLLLLYFVIYWPITLFYIFGVVSAIFVSNYLEKIRDIDKIITNTIQLVTILIIVYYSSITIHKYSWSGIINHYNFIILLSSLFVFIITLFNEKSFAYSILSKKFFITLGTVSYTLYLAHPYSYLLSLKITNFLILHNINLSVATVIFYFLLFVTTAILVFLVHKFIETKIYKIKTGKELFK